ncbi:VanW family protein [Sanguibacter sp. 25GB23B1]|uniref:VanW family protein n=1 Tax=unclassified Sanguibacter TaxID=2645534 RepID=UPI0032B017AC
MPTPTAADEPATAVAPAPADEPASAVAPAPAEEPAPAVHPVPAAEPAPAAPADLSSTPAPVAAPTPAVELPIILRTKPASDTGAEGAGGADTKATLTSTMLPPRAAQPAPTDATVTAPAIEAQSAERAQEDVATAAAEAPVVSSFAASAEPRSEPTTSTPVTPSDPDEVVVEASPLGAFDGSSTPSRLPKVLLWTGLGLLIAAGAYLGAQWYFADRIPRGTTVAGVDIGGLPAAEATARLTAELGGVATQPVPVTAGGGAGSLDPGTAGLTFDAEATVAGLTEFTLDPRPLLAQIAGGDDVDPVTVVDEELFEAATEALVVDLETPATSGTVAFVDAAAVQTPAVDGTSVDPEHLRETIVDSWLTAARPLELDTVPLEPEITQAETDAAFAEAQRVAAAPVSVSVSGQLAELPVDALTAAATYAPVDGALVLAFDGPTLVEGVLARTTDLLSNAADASFAFVDGVPQIQPGTPGTTLDPAALAAGVQEAALGDQRTATVELTASDPAQSTAALEALGVTSKVSEFSTPLTNEPDRTENLRIAAGKVTGTLVRPGETFSLLDTIGPITTANGYLQAHVIVDGEITNGTGGGLSQMSTTTYNAGFFAGMIDVSHTPHSYWFSRYPEGREATLYEGQIDMEWRNDSPYGVLLQSWVAGGRVHVAAWSTPHYTVETTTSPRSNVVSPTTQHKAGPSCSPQSAGGPGFSVSVWRKVTVTATAEVVVDETNSWRYKPQNAVVCDG